MLKLNKEKVFNITVSNIALNIKFI